MSRRARKKAVATKTALPHASGSALFSPKSWVTRLLIVLAGIILGQAILYGPSLVGAKILLPLDLLALPDVYLPKTPELEKIVPHDPSLSDLILQFETERRFTAAEIRAGRFPMWSTYQYVGSPLVWPKFSPFIFLGCLVLSPVILPWIQLLAAMISGLGLYLFCRRALGLEFWAAAIPAWCYPMTGFFVFWQGFPTCGAAYWFPWLLLAVDRTVRRSSQIAWAGLSAVTCLVLLSGHIDVAGQALLASGLYATWCLWSAYGKQWYQAKGRAAVFALAAGWCLGLFLAAPHVLPFLEYAQTGVRMEHRRDGGEERPPAGLSALPQTVLPDLYGTRNDRIVDGNQIESSAAIYAGLFATLLVAPLAWCNRRRRSVSVFFFVFTLLGVSWCLNVPGVVDLLRLPGLRMMSHNRLVFIGSLAILALASIGLDALLRGEVSRRRWFLWPATVLAGLGIWCFFRACYLPDPVATNQDEAVRMWFIRSYLIAGILCGLGVAGWVLLSSWNGSRPWFVPALGIFLVGDLLWFAHDRSAQTNPAFYYPRIPLLEEIARSAPGRIIGDRCLPATLAQTHELRDIRGYDGVDPSRLMALMGLAVDPSFLPHISEYARTQWFLPRIEFEEDGVRLPSILDMLGVRYVVFRGTAEQPRRPAFQSDDYWALVNHAALPRTFVPRRVEMATNYDERLEKLASPEFDPRAVAYVESVVSLPDDCRGEANISAEIPTRVTVSVKMETPGLVVLTDLWDKGWRAYLNGQPVPILRANHAVRGVLVPAGLATLEFRYESASLVLGIKLAILAAVILLGWLLFVGWRARRVERVA